MADENCDWSDTEDETLGQGTVEDMKAPVVQLTASKAPRRTAPPSIELTTQDGRAASLTRVRMQDSREFLVPFEGDAFLIADAPTHLDEQEGGDVFRAMLAAMRDRGLKMNDVCGYALAGQTVVAFVVYGAKVLVLTPEIEQTIVDSFGAHLDASWTAARHVREPLQGVLPLARFLEIGVAEAKAGEHTNLCVGGKNVRPVVSSTRLTALHRALLPIPSRDGREVLLACEPMPSNYKMPATTEGARMSAKGAFYVVKHAAHVFPEIARASEAVKVVHTYAKDRGLVLNDLCGLAVFVLNADAGKTTYANYTAHRFFVFRDAADGAFERFTVVLGTGQMENDGANGILASNGAVPEHDQLAVDALKQKHPDIVAMCDDANVRVDLSAVLQFGTADFSASNLLVDGKPVVPLTSSLRLRNLCGPKRKRAVAEGAADEHHPVTKRARPAASEGGDLISVPDPFEDSPLPEGVPAWFAGLAPDADGWDALQKVGRTVRGSTGGAKAVLDYSDAKNALVLHNRGATAEDAAFNTRRTSAALVFLRAMVSEEAARDGGIIDIWQIADSLVQKHFAKWAALDPSWTPPVEAKDGAISMVLDADADAQPGYAKAAASILLSGFDFQ
jgi:hypothetical protein